jgi:hypothetical protein
MATARDLAMAYLGQHYSDAAASPDVSWDGGRRIEDAPWPLTSEHLTYQFVPAGINEGGCCVTQVSERGSKRYLVGVIPRDRVPDHYVVEVDLAGGGLIERAASWFGTIATTLPESDFDACFYLDRSEPETCIALDAGGDVGLLDQIDALRDTDTVASVDGTVAHEGDLIVITVTEVGRVVIGTPARPPGAD